MISCLLVTKNIEKFPLLKKSVQAFIDQTQDDIELVIVCGDEKFSDILKYYYADICESGVCTIHYIDEDGLGLTLGDMRNISIEKANGDILVNWDDDDINHPLRLETQYNFMVDNDLDASFLSDQLHYFYDTSEMYWVNWNDGIPGTIMFKKKCYETVKHTSRSRHEDCDFKTLLFTQYKTANLSGVGYLYLYTFNDLCVFEREHHVTTATRKDLSFMKNIETKVKALNYIKYYDIPQCTFIHPSDKFIN